MPDEPFTPTTAQYDPALTLEPTAPLHVRVRSDEFYEGLDAGIRYAIRALHADGIPTCQSCEGGEGHAYARPSVDLSEDRAWEAMERLEARGIRVRDVSTIWRIENASPVERIWRITLRDKLTDRADTLPMFFTGHLHRDCWETASQTVKAGVRFRSGALAKDEELTG